MHNITDFGVFTVQEKGEVWTVVDGDGYDVENVICDTEEEAREECDRLHEKYDLNTDDGFGNYMPWYTPKKLNFIAFS